ncbi:hypothetical protein [Dongia sp.]|jgi:uncharacterized membrane protein|uniref:hypothetical protein n=1 Tax=Dongia sp. TaxID=1977262 RepID=UPI0035AE0739
MPFSPNRRAVPARGKWSAAIFALIAAAYPVLVYWLHERVPFIVFALAACLLLLLRAFIASGGMMRLLRLPLLCAAAMLAILALIDPAVAAKAYPALLSALLATVFGNSLRHPPSLVERMARLRDPALSTAGIAYCRKVTWVWALWLLANAVIAASLSLTHSISFWALWTGFISYVCSGALFLGEMLLRPWLLARAGGIGR